MREHNEVDASHGRGGVEKGFDPLPVRIENLKKVIERLRKKTKRTNAENDLLCQYEAGLIELEARLEQDQLMEVIKRYGTN